MSEVAMIDYEAAQVMLTHLLRIALVLTVLLSLVAWLIVRAEGEKAEKQKTEKLKEDGRLHPLPEMRELGLERCDLSEYFKIQAGGGGYNNRRGML